jgi:S-adenosylmethionine:tRNA ribosyltransferase-isomerase
LIYKGGALQRALFDYDLPEELVAQRPLPERDGARLLVLGDAVEHARVLDLDRLLPKGALLVVNDTRVVPARLLGKKRDTGGRVEIFLLERVGDGQLAIDGRTLVAERWRALGRSSKPLRPGAVLDFGERLAGTIASHRDDGGVLEVLLGSPEGRSVAEAIAEVGHMPLPPYVRREDDAADRERYQTIFARVPGAVAAPTAGLHLSERLLSRLESAGVGVARVTLHVGLGTFQPVTAEDLDHHPMHTERYAVSEDAARAIAEARARGAAVVAVGTTVVRTLESAADPERRGHVRASEGETRLLIQPGHRFRVVDALVTNFHLPQSTLLALVCALGGRERVLSAYRAAVAERYRFFSYGDAMLVHPPRAAKEGA